MAGRENRLDRLSRLNMFSYPKRKARPPSPREQATFLQVIFCSWLHPLLRIGMKRPITEADLYPTLYEDQSDHIGDKLESMWGHHLERCKIKGKEPSLVKLLLGIYTKKFLFFGIFSLAEEGIFRMIQVISVGYVLDYYEGHPLTTLTGTFVFGVGGIIIGSASFLVSYHWSIFNLHHVCTNIRLGLSSLVYRKLLHLNQVSLRASTVGQIVTMIASDLHRFDRKHIQVNYTWISPIHLGIVIYILYFHFEYGLTSLIGLFVLIFLTLIQYLMGKKFLQIRQKRVDSSDMRIRVVVELINAFYTIKVQCWERFFQEKALENRKYELKFVRTSMFLRLLNTAIGFVVTKMSVFLTLLIAFIFEERQDVNHGSEVNSKRIFVTLILYEHVRVNSMVLFPQAINDMAELLCSCRRIQQFLLLEEKEVPAVLYRTPAQAEKKSGRIEVVNLTCKWGSEDCFSLSDMNFTVNAGQLLVIAGPVASGKSTIIAALLGELTPDTGHIYVGGRVAYVPQTPILFPGSLRRNIIFGYGYNKSWYNEVISMCDLRADFERMPNGDSSIAEITQMTTSQRAKICLARAVYANAEIYLLDDPLHSLDVKHHSLLLETVIKGALSDKAVVLVTHQIHFLEEANEILLINDGQIQTHGTYEQLLKAGIQFYRDMEEEDDFYFDEDDVGEDSASLLHRDLVPDLIQPKDLRRRGSIQLEIDHGTKDKGAKGIKRVSMAPAKDNRTNSVPRTNSKMDTSATANRNNGVLTQIAMLANDEEAYDVREHGLAPARVSFRLYYDFLRTGSSRCWLMFLFLFCVVSQALYTATDYWIEHWAHAEEERRHKNESNSDRAKHIIVYSVLITLIVVLSFGRSILIFKVCINASATFFVKLLDATLTSRMNYFETSCAGSAINRLSKDMVIIDDLIPPTLLEVLGVFFEIFGAQFLLAYANPWFIIPSLAFFMAIIMVYKIYHLTAADLKRIEGNARSPVYSHLSRTLQGVTVIRAFGQEQAFSMIFDRLQDNHTASWYLFVASQTWLAVVIDCISCVLVACISLSFFYLDDVAPAVVGLTVSKMIELSILVQFCAAEMSNTETQMISVERVLEYAQPQETEHFEQFDGPNPPEGWPTRGEIEIRDLHLMPNRTSRRHLKNMSVTIEGGQWVGIVGKSGSGKSTFLNSLFRISDLESGDIVIDDVDITNIGLHNLRSRISIIPQNPCMFQGTVRQNLDPLNKFSDEEIWQVLDECTLYDAVQKMEDGLSSNVTEYGINFSSGQRQFICLARVLLEKNRILCCDEPCTSLDGLSQVVMMSKLREHFKDCTVLMVAHRVHYVVECDRILVLEAGEIVEDGKPLELLERKSGPFHDLISHLNEQHFKELVELAKEAQEKKLKKRRSRSGSVGPVKLRKSLDYTHTSAAIHGAMAQAKSGNVTGDKSVKGKN